MTIREAIHADIEALARFHVKTFNETHVGPFGRGPSFEIREQQWREAFEKADGSWFCFVAEDQGELIGFAKGVPYTDAEHSEFSGELNKIYVLRKFHRRGLGRRLVGCVARRFVEQGITSMLLFGEARNPSNGFYERLGAEKLLSKTGEFHGGYGWRDLRKLVSICTVE